MGNREQHDRNGVFDSLKNKGKGKFMKSLVSALVLGAMGIGYLEEAGARLDPAVCAALPDAAAMPPGANRGVIDDFGNAPAITAAMRGHLLDMLYNVFSQMLIRGGGGAEFAYVAEAILRAGGVVPVDALPVLAGAIGHPACPFTTIVVANAQIAPGVPVPPGIALHVRNAARRICIEAGNGNIAAGNVLLGGVAAPIPVIGNIAGAAPAITQVQLNAAALALPGVVAMVAANPIGPLYEHMRDIRHLWSLPPGAGPAVLDTHYLSWCRAARVNTDQQIFPRHSSFTLTVAGAAADFTTILAAIATAVQNPANIISIDPFPLAGGAPRFVDILVNVGPIIDAAGNQIKAIKYNQGNPNFPGHIGDGIVDAIACIAQAIITPALVAPLAVPAAAAGAAWIGALPPPLAAGALGGAAPIAIVGGLIPAPIPTPAAAPALPIPPILLNRINAANAAAMAVAGVLPGVLAAVPPGTPSQVLRWAVLRTIGANVVPMLAVTPAVRNAAAVAATVVQANNTMGVVGGLGAGGPVFLPLTPAVIGGAAAAPVPAIPSVTLANAMAAALAAAGGAPLGPIFANIAAGGPPIAGAAAVRAAITLVAGGAVPIVNLANALNAITTASAALLPADGGALAAPAGPAAQASAPQPIGVVAIRIRNTGEIISIYPI